MPAWEVVMLLVRLEMLVRFLMICDVVCIIGNPNLVYLLERGLLCVLVGREIGLWVIGIVGELFLSLQDECMLKVFFLAFRI